MQCLIENVKREGDGNAFAEAGKLIEIEEKRAKLAGPTAKAGTVKSSDDDDLSVLLGAVGELGAISWKVPSIQSEVVFHLLVAINGYSD